MNIHLFDRDEQSQAYAVGQTIFQAGDPGEHMYAVIDGSVDIIIRGKTDETVGAGGVFGEMALVEDRARIATAQVNTAAKLVQIDRKRFEFLVQQNPYFALQLMAVMARRLRRMDEKL